MTPTHRSDDMTDNLRDAAQAVLDRWDSLDWKAAPTADYMNRLRAALAAAPQPAPAIVGVDMASGPDFTAEYVVMRPAPADREALVDVIAEARGHFTPREMAWAGNGYHDEDRAIADALLARGLRLPGGEETMAWAVVEEGKPLNADWIKADRRDAELFAGTRDRVVPVAIRVVDGGDDAA